MDATLAFALVHASGLCVRGSTTKCKDDAIDRLKNQIQLQDNSYKQSLSVG